MTENNPLPRVEAGNLLHDNQRLLTENMALEVECARLQDAVARGKDVVSDNEALRWLVDFLTKEKTRLLEQVAERKVAAQELERERATLKAEINGIALQSREFTDNYVAVEQQNTRLANLCVSMYRLHSSLDRNEILTAIQEIVINLIGSEELAIFEVKQDQRELALISSFGLDTKGITTIPLGQGLMGRAAETGRLFVVRRDARTTAENSDFDSRLSAFIPLKVDGRVWGAIAVFSLLPQRGAVGLSDVELFDLLATQAGLALHCATLDAEAKKSAEVSR